MHRQMVTPGTALASERVWYETDIRHVLPSIVVPTLVIDRDGVMPEKGEYTASLIPGSERVVVHGDDAIYFLGDQDAIVDAIREFVGARKSGTRPGSRAGHRAVHRHRRLHRQGVRGRRRRAGRSSSRSTTLPCAPFLARYRGNEVKTTGDGFLATFDGPARAVKCAQAICEAVRPLGLEVRAGCHTGEIELLGADVGGVAVHIGARVAALAGPPRSSSPPPSRTSSPARASSSRTAASTHSRACPTAGTSTRWRHDRRPDRRAGRRRVDGASIAYQDLGDPAPVTLGPRHTGHVTQLEIDWEWPALRPSCAALAQHAGAHLRQARDRHVGPAGRSTRCSTRRWTTCAPSWTRPGSNERPPRHRRRWTSAGGCLRSHASGPDARSLHLRDGSIRSARRRTRSATGGGAGRRTRTLLPIGETTSTQTTTCTGGRPRARRSLGLGGSGRWPATRTRPRATRRIERACGRDGRARSAAHIRVPRSS